MAHDEDIAIEDDAEALRVRRADLYAFMQEITAAALMLPQPETYIEAERAVRTIATADRIIQQFDLIKPDDEAAVFHPTPAGLRNDKNPLNFPPDVIIVAALIWIRTL